MESQQSTYSSSPASHHLVEGLLEEVKGNPPDSPPSTTSPQSFATPTLLDLSAREEEPQHPVIQDLPAFPTPIPSPHHLEPASVTTRSQSGSPSKRRRIQTSSNLKAAAAASSSLVLRSTPDRSRRLLSHKVISPRASLNSLLSPPSRAPAAGGSSSATLGLNSSNPIVIDYQEYSDIILVKQEQHKRPRPANPQIAKPSKSSPKKKRSRTEASSTSPRKPRPLSTSPSKSANELIHLPVPDGPVEEVLIWGDPLDATTLPAGATIIDHNGRFLSASPSRYKTHANNYIIKGAKLTTPTRHLRNSAFTDASPLTPLLKHNEERDLSFGDLKPIIVSVKESPHRNKGMKGNKGKGRASEAEVQRMMDEDQMDDDDDPNETVESSQKEDDERAIAEELKRKQEEEDLALLDDLDDFDWSVPEPEVPPVPELDPEGSVGAVMFSVSSTVPFSSPSVRATSVVPETPAGGSSVGSPLLLSSLLEDGTEASPSTSNAHAAELIPADYKSNDLIARILAKNAKEAERMRALEQRAAERLKREKEISERLANIEGLDPSDEDDKHDSSVVDSDSDMDMDLTKMIKNQRTVDSPASTSRQLRTKEERHPPVKWDEIHSFASGSKKTKSSLLDFTVDTKTSNSQKQFNLLMANAARRSQYSTTYDSDEEDDIENWDQNAWKEEQNNAAASEKVKRQKKEKSRKLACQLRNGSNGDDEDDELDDDESELDEEQILKMEPVDDEDGIEAIERRERALQLLKADKKAAQLKRKEEMIRRKMRVGGWEGCWEDESVGPIIIDDEIESPLVLGGESEHPLFQRLLSAVTSNDHSLLTACLNMNYIQGCIQSVKNQLQLANSLFDFAIYSSNSALARASLESLCGILTFQTYNGTPVVSQDQTFSFFLSSLSKLCFRGDLIGAIGSAVDLNFSILETFVPDGGVKKITREVRDGALFAWTKLLLVVAKAKLLPEAAVLLLTPLALYMSIELFSKFWEIATDLRGAVAALVDVALEMKLESKLCNGLVEISKKYEPALKFAVLEALPRSAERFRSWLAIALLTQDQITPAMFEAPPGLDLLISILSPTHPEAIHNFKIIPETDYHDLADLVRIFAVASHELEAIFLSAKNKRDALKKLAAEAGETVSDQKMNENGNDPGGLDTILNRLEMIDNGIVDRKGANLDRTTTKAVLLCLKVSNSLKGRKLSILQNRTLGGRGGQTSILSHFVPKQAATA